MRFLIITAPFVGHLFPTIPIGEQLQKRGHEVLFSTGSFYKDMILKEGFRFSEVGVSGDSKKSDTQYIKLFGKKSGNEETEKKLLAYWVGRVRENVWDVLNVVDYFKPDAILLETNFLGGEIAAQASKVPFASISMYPGQLGNNPEYYYTGTGIPYDGKEETKQKSKELVTEIRKRKDEANEIYNKIRTDFGLNAIEHPTIFGPISKRLVLLPTAHEVEYMRDDYGDKYHFIGSSLWFKGKDYDPDTADKIMSVVKERARGRKIVYVTLGTVLSYTETGLFTLFLNAFEEMKDEVFFFMTMGGAGIFDYQPENVQSARYVPMNHILPHIDAAFHQCGFSTFMGILEKGIPSVAIPILFDQVENASRLAYHKCGINLALNQLSKDRIKEAVKEILSNTEIKNNCTKFSKIIRNYPGAVKGAELLENMVKNL